MPWDPGFIDRSPALAVFAHVGARLRECRHWPDRGTLQSLCDSHAVANARGMPLRLVSERTEKEYEARIYLDAEMHVREGVWHDLFNVLAWLAYPCTKAAVNARHYEHGTNIPAGAGCAPGTRGPVRDALTLFDESGAIVTSSDPDLLELLRAFRWKELFWRHRPRVEQSMRCFVLGHALAEKALAPYVGMTAHAILVLVDEHWARTSPARQAAEVDRLAAQIVRSAQAFARPRTLAPLPVLGIPGWWRDNAREAFYDNASYFRAGRTVRKAVI